MPTGVNVQVDDGFAILDFEDRSLRGPALAALRKGGAPIDVMTRSGPRKRYRVPEGNARSAGLVDTPVTLPSGDTGAAQALVDSDPNVNPGDDGAEWHHPVLTSKDNVYVGTTPASEVLEVTSPSTTVTGSIPASPPVSPLHSEVIATVKAAGATTVETEDEPDETWKVADLKAYAEARGIDLGDATRKDDILAAIQRS
jgi:hypothetical protein